MAEEKITELENGAGETLQNETQKNTLERNRASGSCGTTPCSATCGS